ncbi:unnamed protein product [Blepharisma stoltei]|uniref:Protein kinase domain-containing protein n=1 Tax=Blepharisma stoltei TaxID=1481888 RepID=A0AAU9ISJ0_9CILI|nr:unnamed protein product [Blepharisma stoltei]
MGCCASRPPEKTEKRKVTLKRSVGRKKTKASKKSDLDKSSETHKRSLSRRVTPCLNKVENTQGSIFDFYQKVKNIYKARSGSIWLALDKRTNIQKAIKEIKKNTLESSAQDLFLEEVEKLKELDHPNIVKFHELVISSDTFYLVFEFMAGENLFKRLKRKYINEQLAANYTKNLLEGLEYCHNIGILHRNISLENMLFVSKKEDTSIKLNDFGFTWRKNMKQTQSNEFTKDESELKYLAPETFEGIYNDKSDIWSLGIALYVMLIGRFPFNTAMDVKRGIDWSNDMFLIYSAEMKDFLSKMLAPDYKERFSAIEALNHPWLQIVYPSPQNLLNEQTVAIISKFLTRNKIEQYLLTYVASLYSDFNEEKRHIKLFKFLDKNYDGLVDKQELKEIWKGKIFEDPQEMEEILLGIDMEEDYSFSFTMFMAALADWNSAASRNKLESALKSLSQNNTRRIDVNYIKRKIPAADNKEWEQFYRIVGNVEGSFVNIDQLKEVLLK